MSEEEINKIIEAGKFDVLRGKCALCETEKNLPVLFDDKFICSECHARIKSDTETLNLAQCVDCNRLLARSWSERGKAIEIENETFAGEEDFLCLSCAKRERCFICDEARPCPFISPHSEGGYFIYCQSCHDEAELVDAAGLLENTQP